MQQNQLFEELTVGDRHRMTRLCTEDDMLVFANVSGNHDPLHTPVVDGRQTSEEGASDELSIPEMLVASMISAVIGNYLPGPGSRFRRHVLEFHHPARVGDELTVEVSVAEKREDGTVAMQTSVTRTANGQSIAMGSAVVEPPTKRCSVDPDAVPGLIVQRHRHYEKLLAMVEGLPPIRTAVICPEEANSLAGALAGFQRSLITPILVGNRARIQRAADQIEADIAGIELRETATDTEAAQVAVNMVHDGEAHAIMKGHLHTDVLLHPVMDGKTGLRTGRRITHVFVTDTPGIAHPIIVSDAAINIQPDLMTKVDIVKNAIDVAHAIGIEEPKVAVLSAVETVNPKIQSSVDAALLSKMADRGQITGAQVDGPLAMDNAIDIGAARNKGIRSEVAGMGEILIAPNLDAGNILFKQLAFIAHAEVAGLVVGARVPIILNSRSDGEMSRLASCAIAALYHKFHSEKQ